MIEKIILHIGCEKTGTTSIQNSLYKNRALLLSQYGILYPDSLGKRNHTKLAVFTCDDGKLNRFLPNNQTLDQFRQELQVQLLEEIRLSPANTLLISCEWLHPRVRTVHEFSRLKKLLFAISKNIEIILYIRPQDKMAKSLYSTSLKAGNTHCFKFPDFIENQPPYYYNFFAIYKNWTSEFGLMSVNLGVFDRKVLFDSDVVKDFLQKVNVSPENFEFIPEGNLSINALGIYVMRLLNVMLLMAGDLISDRRKRLLRQFFANRFKGSAKLSGQEQSDEYLRRFEELNNLLVKEYFKNTGKSLNF